jgi:GGDEF domain-containing protein
MAQADRDLNLHLFHNSPNHEELDRIGFMFDIDPAHLIVEAHARALAKIESRQAKIDELEAELFKAQHDPLTGFWMPGPGFEQLGEMISMVERNRAGEGDEGPNAIFGIGMDTEALHYTNNYYSHKAGDARITFDARRLVEAADVVRESVRSRERRVLGLPANHQDRRLNENDGKDRRSYNSQDLLIRTGGDEFMAALAIRLTPEDKGDELARMVIGRLTALREKNIPASRILVRAGFYMAGQTAEDFKHAVDPKAHLSRREKAARPLSKIMRLGLGHYRPPFNENQEI